MGLIDKLPKPPPNKIGWPWTKESRPLIPVMPGGRFWPKISIVTPSFNQGQYLEETIRSVLLQNYPNLEYIIMDGGSTDNSVEIIKKYEAWLTYWVSEKDNGQADAIYRGFQRATGEIGAWINSDDYYLPGAFREVAKKFIKDPDIELLIGGLLHVNSSGRRILEWPSFPQSFNSLLCFGQRFGQMASFWKRRAFFDVGGFDRSLRFCFDYDLFLRLTRRQLPKKLDCTVAAFRSHELSKTTTIWEKVGLNEFKIIQERHGIHSIPQNVRVKAIKNAELQFTINRLKPLKYIIFRPRLFFRTLLSLLKSVSIGFE